MRFRCSKARRAGETSCPTSVVARDLGEAYSPEEIEHLIVEGLADIDRGDVIDGEDAFRELRAYGAERRRQHA